MAVGGNIASVKSLNASGPVVSTSRYRLPGWEGRVFILRMRFSCRLLRRFALLAAILSSTAAVACGAAAPAGIPPEATPLEEQLAAFPEPSVYYRAVFEMWDGVPGLAALRERWDGFATTKPGYAVLSALLSEAEGQPEAALEKLRRLPGEHAAWQSARIHAALGHENDAVLLLEQLVNQQTSPDLASRALMALTERDCIRGDFAGALARSRAAWAAQGSDCFRLQVLERHVSLLVECGGEKAFLKEQQAEMQEAEPGRSRTARHVLAALGAWFTGDPALRALRTEVLKEGNPDVDFQNFFPQQGRLPGWHCGFLPSGAELLKLARDPAAPLSLALPAAAEVGAAVPPPDSLDAWPLLQRSLAAQPIRTAARLFMFRDGQGSPHRALLEDVQRRLAPVASGRVVSLRERAWSGLATAADADELIRIIGEAPEGRRYAHSPLPGSVPYSIGGWPVVVRMPQDFVIWNLAGERWAAYYREICRLQSVRQQEVFFSPQPHRAAGLYGWRHWRPVVPNEGMEMRMEWAWRELCEMAEGTPARFEQAARLLNDPGDRAAFAAVTGHASHLAEWCADPAFVKQMRTSAIMLAIYCLRPNDSQLKSRGLAVPGSAAILALVDELSARLKVKAADLTRVLAPWSMDPKMLAAMDEKLAAMLGVYSLIPPVKKAAWRRHLDGVPHPLFGLNSLTPSVARFVRLAAGWKPGANPGWPPYPYRSIEDGAVEELLGWAAREPVPAPLLDELASFETAHPLKKMAQRWQALIKENTAKQPKAPAAGGRRAAPGRELTPTTYLTPAQTASLAQLAAEEKNSHTWQLVHLALAKNDAGKQEALLQEFRSRSPLTAGTWLEPPPQAQPLRRPQPTIRTAAETADLLAEAWSTPEGRQALESAGAMEALLRDSQLNALRLAIRPFTADQARREELVTALLQKQDALAARAAVCLAQGVGLAFQKETLVKARSAFPDDPEIVIAHALLKSKDPAAKEEFLRGLRSLKGLYYPTPGRTLHWCGILFGMLPWRDATVAEAITAFVAKTDPNWQIPEDWYSLLEGVLTSEEMVRQARNVPLLVKTLLRFAKPIPLHNGRGEVWLRLCKTLAAAGHAESAILCAGGVLAIPRGGLFPPGIFGPDWPWENPVANSITSRGTDGWALLKLATRFEAGSLAEQLRLAHAAHPADEHIALNAVLARALAGLPPEQNVALLTGMAPASRHTVLGVASWLLPQTLLPPALCIEAWQAEATRLFQADDHDTGNRSFVQGLMYLEKLADAGAHDQARALLPRMIECFAATIWPGKSANTAAALVWKYGMAPDRAAFAEILASRLEKQRQRPEFPSLLAQALDIFSAAPESIPEPVAALLTALLQSAEKTRLPNDAAETALGLACEAVVLHPRWRQQVRVVLASRLAGGRWSESSGTWKRLALLMESLDSGLLVPDLHLTAEPVQQGEITLRWRFAGLALPPPGTGMEDPRPSSQPGSWQALARTLAEKFDAVMVVENMSGAGRRVAARQERMTAEGEMKLTGLPAAGRIIVYLFGREAPHAAGGSTPLALNSAPILMDTAAAAPPKKHPTGWQLLAEPAVAGNIRAWNVRSRSGPFPRALHLLLLDEAGQVCAAAQVERLAMRSAAVSGAEQGPTAVIPRSALAASLTSLQRAAFSVTVAGPPRQFALALPVRDDAAAAEADAGGDVPAGSMTVQEQEDGFPTAAAERVEIERVWFAVPDSYGASPMLSTNGTFAAWLHKNRLWLVDVSKDSGPFIKDLPVPETTAATGMEWAAARLRLTFDHRSDAQKPETLLLEVDPVDTAKPVSVTRLPGWLRFVSPRYRMNPGVSLLLEQEMFSGVITPEGSVLQVRADQKHPFSHWLSATKVGGRQGTDRRHPVFDWSSGALELHFLDQLPPATPSEDQAPAWQVNGDTLLLVSGTQRRSLPVPLQLGGVVPLGADRLAVISGAGAARLRIVAPEPRK